MLDGQGCLLPVRHFHRKDTSVMLSSWYPTGLSEASDETSPDPDPNRSTNLPHFSVSCPSSPSSETDSEPFHASNDHGELLNPNFRKSCHCTTASHVVTNPAQVWDSNGELRNPNPRKFCDSSTASNKITKLPQACNSVNGLRQESSIPCTSLEFDCSSTSPSRSAQIFSCLPALAAQIDPPQARSDNSDFEEVDATRCFLSGEDCILIEPSRSLDAEGDSSKILNEDVVLLESAGASSSILRYEVDSQCMCEDGECATDRALEIESGLKQEDVDALQSNESHVGSVKDLDTPEDSSSEIANVNESCVRVPHEEGKSKDSQEAYGNLSLAEGCSASSSRSSSAQSCVCGGDASEKGCKRLRISNSDEFSCGTLVESMAMVADTCKGKVACNSNDENAQWQSYIPGLDHELAGRCLAFVPLSELHRLAMVGKQHRDLVKSREIFKLRQMYRTVEHLVFIYTSGARVWTAYDANRNVWRTLPPANVNEAFESSDRESLSAGTHVLWLGKECFEFVYYRYDLLSNNWEQGPAMVNPRCLFASASCGDFAFVAGGFGPGGSNGGLSLLNSAERYSSLTGEWEPLPPMATPRHKCSGFFMDGKFYVIGGRDADHRHIMSGEEYNPSTRVWRTIPDMYFTPEVARRGMVAEPSPPLVAVVNNELYAVENTTNSLKMYNKHNNTWRNLGHLPVPADLHNGWGVAFKALGNKLFVMGDVDGITAFCWQPGPNAMELVWQRLCSRDRGTSFLYNCAVMAC